MGKRTGTPGNRTPESQNGVKPEAARVAPLWATSPIRRRQISPQAGKGLEILGHSIEYLYDELSLDQLSGQSSSDPASKSVCDAIELLKKNSRQIYFSCPIAPTVGERLRSLWRIRIPFGSRPA